MKTVEHQLDQFMQGMASDAITSNVE